VYSLVKLRLPDDELLKKSVNFIIDEMKGFNSKETALTLWALAKMNYPSKHIQSLILRKVQSQVEACLQDESLFRQAPIEGSEEEPGEMERLESGQSVSMYYWGMAKMGF